MTIGDLTPNDIGRTTISLGSGDGRIEGVLKWLSTEVDIERSSLSPGKSHTDYRTTVSIAVGEITVENLPVDHPCQVQLGPWVV